VIQYSAPPPIGGYQWRKARNLLGIRDRIRLYRAIRCPRGPYPVPLPGDLINFADVGKNGRARP